MKKFSDRYGYTQAEDMLIREKLTEPIVNSILNWIREVAGAAHFMNYDIEKAVRIKYLNRVLSEYDDTLLKAGHYNCTFSTIISSEDYMWYEKLNILEFYIEMLKNLKYGFLDKYIRILNEDFGRHNFSYRIINYRIEEITGSEEINEIEEAHNNPMESVRVHINSALNHVSATQKNPDYRASIKESISAVEALCRDLTGQSSLGDALKKLKHKGIEIHDLFVKTFELLYGYTNDKTSGIRHALMDSTKPPSSDEAIYMLVTCSAFINYLQKKADKIK